MGMHVECIHLRSTVIKCVKLVTRDCNMSENSLIWACSIAGVANIRPAG